MKTSIPRSTNATRAEAASRSLPERDGDHLAPQQQTFSPNSIDVSERVIDLEDALNRLEINLGTLQNRMVALKADHDSHLSTSSDTLQQVARLLATTTALSENFKTYEARTFTAFQMELKDQKDEWLNAAAFQNRRFEEEVKKLLANFRSEVIAVARESEARHEEHRLQLDFLAEKLSATAESQTTIREDHDRIQRSLNNFSTEFNGFKETVMRRLEAMENSLGRSVEQALTASSENRLEIQRSHTHNQQLYALCKEECNRHADAQQASALAKVWAKFEETEIRHDSQRVEAFGKVKELVGQLRGDLSGVLDEEVSKLTSRLQLLAADQNQSAGRLSDLRDSHEKNFSEFHRICGALEADNRATRDKLIEVTSSVKDTINAALEEVQSVLDQANAKVASMETSVNAVNSGLQLVTAARDKEEKAMHEWEGRLSAVNKQFQQSVLNAVENQSANQLDQMKKLEAEWDKRHRRLVESTHEALSQITSDHSDGAMKYQTLRSEIQALTDTVRTHTALIENHTLDGTVDGALTEVKDWVRELERRVVSRAEVEEALATLTTQVQGLRQSVQSSESTLSQRLDAEKVARERDSAHHRTQLQRLMATTVSTLSSAESH